MNQGAHKRVSFPPFRLAKYMLHKAVCFGLLKNAPLLSVLDTENGVGVNLEQRGLERILAWLCSTIFPEPESKFKLRKFEFHNMFSVYFKEKKPPKNTFL